MIKRPMHAHVLKVAKGRVILLVFFLLLLYVVVPRIGNFSESFVVLDNANMWFVGGAIACLVLTYMLAAAMYIILSFHPLQYARTLLIQGSSAFANRLLPAGLGALTLYVQYLRKSRHSLSQALAVAGTNNLFGGVGHALLLGVALLLAPEALSDQLSLPHASRAWLWTGAVALVIVLNILVFQRLRRYLYKLTKDVARSVLLYKERPGRLATALACSCMMTISHATVFFMSVSALGIEVGLVQAFIVFTIGIAAATITPTPGGLVGAEAGLTAGLIMYSVGASEALAAALLYRFLTYWLPLVPGFVLFTTNRRLYL